MAAAVAKENFMEQKYPININMLGFWQEFDTDGHVIIFQCSNCEFTVVADIENREKINNIRKNYNYCPQCGVKMLKPKKYTV